MLTFSESQSIYAYRRYSYKKSVLAFLGNTNYFDS